MTIHEILKQSDEYLKSFEKNTIDGWWELEVGLPKGWVFNNNKDIECELLQEKELGNIVKIKPKNSKVIIDDLIKFLNIIIITNKKIEEKEKEFTTKMEEMKSVLEKEAKKFYEELDELKINSFKNINKDFEKSISTTENTEDLKNNKDEKSSTTKRKTIRKKQINEEIDSQSIEEEIVNDELK
ncbi:MAG TPA: hypothetical protein PLN85_00315 [archaeon]|nr:hypothetical protein [archaeon]